MLGKEYSYSLVRSGSWFDLGTGGVVFVESHEAVWAVPTGIHDHSSVAHVSNLWVVLAFGSCYTCGMGLLLYCMMLISDA